MNRMKRHHKLLFAFGLLITLAAWFAWSYRLTTNEVGMMTH